MFKLWCAFDTDILSVCPGKYQRQDFDVKDTKGIFCRIQHTVNLSVTGITVDGWTYVMISTQPLPDTCYHGRDKYHQSLDIKYVITMTSERARWRLN